MKDFIFLSNNLGIDIIGNEFIPEIPHSKLLERLALDYGSSIEGRLDSTTHYTNYKILLPIIISNEFKIYYLITRSYKSDDAIYISYRNLVRFKRLDDYKTRLYFDNKKVIDIEVNYRIIKRQIKIIQIYLKKYHEAMKNKVLYM